MLKAQFIDQIDALLPDISDETIVSRKVFSGEGAKVTLFGFAAGEELSEHTAATTLSPARTCSRSGLELRVSTTCLPRAERATLAASSQDAHPTWLLLTAC